MESSVYAVGERVRLVHHATADLTRYERDGEVVAVTRGNVWVYIRKAGDLTSSWNKKKPDKGVVSFAPEDLRKIVYRRNRGN